MVYERAIVNCERCYQLAQGCKQSGLAYVSEDAILTNDRLWAARNEAMKALELVRTEGATDALEQCASCIFESPRIAGLFRTGSDGTV